MKRHITVVKIEKIVEILFYSLLLLKFTNIIICDIMLQFQALFRNGQALGIVMFNNKKFNYQGHKLLRQFTALAQLPPKAIPSAFRHLENLTGQLFPNNAGWQAFLKYFKREWMTIVTPEGFSVYGTNDKTNNWLESYHSRINEVVGKNVSWQTFLSMYIYFLI